MPRAAKISLQPQRREHGKGFRPCADHQASRWAVLRNGTQVQAFASKSDAVDFKEKLERAISRHKSRGPKPQAGTRWSEAKDRVTGSGGVIARSLTKEQHDQLKGIK